MKILHTTLFTLMALMLHGQFTYHHAFTMGNTTYESGQDIAVDADGNAYVAGTFTAWFDADPGPGTTILIPAGNDGFLAKYNDAGALQWAFGIGGTGFDAIYGVEVMGSTVYVTGTYGSVDADFDPGSGTATLPYQGGADVFVARYDLTGTYISSLGIGGGDDDIAVDIEVDTNGDVAICGNFDSSDLDADPGAGTELLSTAGGDDAFLIKYDASETLLFAHAFGGVGTLDSDRAHGLHIAASGDIYVTGSFSSTGGDFDPGPGTVTLSSAGSIDIFISRFNAAGVLQWAQRIGDTGGDLGYGLATDNNGNLYFCGYANSASIDLDPGPGVENFTSGVGQDIVAVKLDVDGIYQWGLRIGGGSSDIAFEVVIDDQQHLFLGGNFGDANVDFDPGPGSMLLSSSSVFETDFFLAQFDLAGNFVDAFDVGGPDTDAIWSMACTPTGRLWVTGNTIGAVDADPGAGTVLMDPFGGSDIFVGAYDHAHPVGFLGSEFQQFTLHPNPATDVVTVGSSRPGRGTLRMLATDGRVLLEQHADAFPLELDLRDVPPGIHTLHVYSGGSSYSRKLMKLP